MMMTKLQDKKKKRHTSEARNEEDRKGMIAKQRFIVDSTKKKSTALTMTRVQARGQGD